MRLFRWEVRVEDERGIGYQVPRLFRWRAERDAARINAASEVVTMTSAYGPDDMPFLCLRNPRAWVRRRGSEDPRPSLEASA